MNVEAHYKAIKNVYVNGLAIKEAPRSNTTILSAFLNHSSGIGDENAHEAYCHFFSI